MSTEDPSAIFRSAETAGAAGPGAASCATLLIRAAAASGALLGTAIILLLLGVNPVAVGNRVLAGSLGSWRAVADTLVVWIPLLLVTSGLLVTFTAGFWNIGIEGQITMGAIFTTGALRWLQDTPLPPAAVIALGVGTGVLGGALWAVLAGMLKTHGGVNEIFGGLGLNYVASALALWLIFGPWKRPGIGSMSGTEPFPEALWLAVFPGSRLSPWALGLGGTALLLVFFALYHTYLGLKLKATGKNPQAAQRLGVPILRYQILAFGLCGGLAGLAGALQVTAVYHRLIPSISSGYGFLGIMVALLAQYRALWAAPLAFLFAMLNIGGIQLPIAFQLDSSLSGVLQGTLVLAVLAAEGWRRRRPAPPAATRRVWRRGNAGAAPVNATEWAFFLGSAAGILCTAGPLLLAVLGEILTERSGVINLSLNGMILLSAMGSFAVASVTGSLTLGVLTGMAVGATVSLLIACSSITLRLSQVAVGFVLAMTCRDLAYFFGTPFVGRPGPRLPAWPLPGLEAVPVLGPLLFRQDLLTYLGFALVALAWFWLFRTRPGLMLRGIGEQPQAAYVRGAQVNRLRYVYTVLGGAISGLAGPAFSLSVKAGWKGTISGLDGMGWIALAIAIFGGLHPLRAAVGAYLFASLQWLGVVLQPLLPAVPSPIFQVAPFPLMMLALLVVGIGDADWTQARIARLPAPLRRGMLRVLRALRAPMPAALGVPFERQ